MRIRELDFLRGIAILLVLFRHSEIDSLLHHAGWIGVDLFFVLSGFLISGLLFRECKTDGSVNAGRFLIRRGFKIYPTFYVFILATVAAKYIKSGEWYDPELILSEVMYVQNYFPGIWQHTWSLAIEEHFYIAFAIIMVMAVQFRMINRGHLLLVALLALYLLFSALRFWEAYQYRHENFHPFFQTHLRIDGIVLGVIVSYLCHFTSGFEKLARYRRVLFGIAVVLVAPAFILPGGSYLMNSAGITVVNIGFALIILQAARGDRFFGVFKLPLVRIVFSAVSVIGIHSYAIYVWHMFVQRVYVSMMPERKIDMLFVALSLILGVAFSLLIEKPFLRVREMYFSKTTNWKTRLS